MLIGGFAAYRRKQLRKGKFTLVRGMASFLDAQTLLVTSGRKQELVTASTFIIATGSVITRVPVPGLWETGCLTSDTALDTEKIPKRLAVLGGGVIAVELGQFFARVGSKTTILQRSERIVRNYDPDVSRGAGARVQGGEDRRAHRREIARGEQDGQGQEDRFPARTRSARRSWWTKFSTRWAARRRWTGLSLENAGVRARRGQAAGERSPGHGRRRIFSPRAIRSGRTRSSTSRSSRAKSPRATRSRFCARQTRSGVPEKIDYRLKALVTFTDPEIASVGLTEAEAKAQGIDYLAASYPFNDHGKAMIGGHEFGFVKLIAEKTRGEIIGAEIIGPHASDLIHELIAVMRYRGTAQELALMPHYHPTLAEIVTYPAEEIAGMVQADCVVEAPLKHV